MPPITLGMQIGKDLSSLHTHTEKEHTLSTQTLRGSYDTDLYLLDTERLSQYDPT